MGYETLLEDRRDFIFVKQEGCSGKGLRCDSSSVSGAVSQRACVYCGARVVLNPITDAFHIVHGPIGCASYTWDIRGSLSSGSELYRNSFSTDLKEKDVIFGGEKRLAAALEEVIDQHHPRLIFVYATCIVGVIGDDVEAVCRRMEAKHKLRIIPVKSPGFSGNKSTGYQLACDAIMELIAPHKAKKQPGINILGDFNLAGELWIVKDYLKQMGVPVIAGITGDSSYDTLIQAPAATLNVVQCAGSSTYLAKRMQEELGIPYIKVSFYGIEDTMNSLLRIVEALYHTGAPGNTGALGNAGATGNTGAPGNADALGNTGALGNADALHNTEALQYADARKRAMALVDREARKLEDFLKVYRPRLQGKKAAIYVGGGFKAISLIKQFRSLGMETVLVGTQTGKKEEYEIITELVDETAVVLDDANPAELERFIKEKQADILVGGVKERPLAYKLGLAFCDHNHERKHPLCGFDGVVNFTKEIDQSINHPVWKYLKEAAL